VDRLTKDIDLFTDRDVAEALSVARGLRRALAAQGLEVRDGPVPPEHRMVVRDPASGRECAVDVFADGGRLHPRVTLDVGPVLHPDDLAADKVLALWSRALPRDFVDVMALTERFDRQRLMELAAAKDSGFSLSTWSDALRAIARLTPDDWARDGVEPAVAAKCQDLFAHWRSQLQLNPDQHPEPRRSNPPPPHHEAPTADH
jgi:nucleotidyltransferase AbiEii toxin of type IV toxin-antitoxin system